jgi:hypothetical protein
MDHTENVRRRSRCCTCTEFTHRSTLTARVITSIERDDHDPPPMRTHGPDHLRCKSWFVPRCVDPVRVAHRQRITNCAACDRDFQRLRSQPWDKTHQSRFSTRIAIQSITNSEGMTGRNRDRRPNSLTRQKNGLCSEGTTPTLHILDPSLGGDGGILKEIHENDHL